jgi:hypothetical protein
MKGQIAQLLYETDIIGIRKASLEVDFCKGFSNPRGLAQLCSYATKEIDDYAIDALICVDETLPLATHCSTILELPLLWLKDGVFKGNTKEIKRAMFLAPLTPGKEHITTLETYFSTSGIELVGIYSFLGMQTNADKGIRIINLIEMAEVLEVFKNIHLITNDEYERLKMF